MDEARTTVVVTVPTGGAQVTSAPQESKMRTFKPVLGQVFGRLTVIEEVRRGDNRKVTVICGCGGSEPFDVRANDLRSGNTTSCGCFQREVAAKAAAATGKENTTHGMWDHRLYATWMGMQKRCYNPKLREYHNYGGRGITVAEEWQGSDGLRAFVAWAEASCWSEGLELDRRDNDAGYSPSNCRWVTRKANSRNRRNNRLVEFNGRLVTLAEAAELTGVNRKTICTRLRRGWPAERALNTPVSAAA